MTVYQLCKRTGDSDDGPAQVVVTLEPGDDPAAWDQACNLAEQNSWDVYREFPGRGTLYVVSYVGGGPYWWMPGTHGGGLHQIGSAGFCWDCLRPDPDLDRPQLGLIRHPVTPGEVEAGAPDYQCFVCSARLGADHAPVPHLVIWGEETHPRCGQCGKAYQIATPEGIGYQEHDRDCPWVTGVGLDEIMDARFQEKYGFER